MSDLDNLIGKGREGLWEQPEKKDSEFEVWTHKECGFVLMLKHSSPCLEGYYFCPRCGTKMINRQVWRGQ